MTWNTHVQRTLSALAIAGTLGAGAWLGMAAASADVFDQRDFPCQEDEVLGYAPQFGPEGVGCVHIDDLRTQGMVYPGGPTAHGVAAADGGVPGPDDYAREVGDDNADGRIDEDESGWDCRTMGNLECGPGNAQGVPPGDYGDIDSDSLEYR